MEKLPSLSVVFPAFNDETSIPLLLKKVTRLLPHVAQRYEIIIVNDGSQDNTNLVLTQWQRKIPFLKIVTHYKNLGYGAALKSGFTKAKYEYIFYTDSDGQYDVLELKKLIAGLTNKVDIVSGYKINRADSLLRKLVGFSYNFLAKMVYHIKLKDVDCDFRLFRRKILKGIKLKTTSGAFDAEFIKRLEDKGAIFNQVPVYHYSRTYGHSQFFRLGNLIKSLWEFSRIGFNANL